MRRLFWIAPLAVVGFAAFVGLGGWIVQQLWNALLPALFGWPVVGFWQALGLLVLARLLFGGLGGPGRGGPWGHRMRERWSRMNPEERDRLRSRMRERFGMGPGPREPGGA